LPGTKQEICSAAADCACNRLSGTKTLAVEGEEKEPGDDE
jgi:hypothetical protein